jgi:hypothetical protein
MLNTKRAIIPYRMKRAAWDKHMRCFCKIFWLNSLRKNKARATPAQSVKRADTSSEGASIISRKMLSTNEFDEWQAICKVIRQSWPGQFQVQKSSLASRRRL